jgi:hypothetical protein
VDENARKSAEGKVDKMGTAISDESALEFPSI